MWSLETIIVVNQKAEELAKNNQPIKNAYEAIGIQMPKSDCDHQRERNKTEATIRVVA